MFCNSWLKSSLISLVSLAAVLALIGSQAEAQVKPFKIFGAGIATEGVPVVPGVAAPHWAIGTATELGFYHGEGHLQLLAFTGPTTAIFSSAPDFVFTAANGDKLAFTYGDIANGATQPGGVTLTPLASGKFVAVFVAEFNPLLAKCTGKFKKVIGGSFTMVAVTEPFVLGATEPVAYVWAGDGSIEFKKGK